MVTFSGIATLSSLKMPHGNRVKKMEKEWKEKKGYETSLHTFGEPPDEHHASLRFIKINV